MNKYIGRLAPSPTGLLHLGHAYAFHIAAERARAAGGQLLLRMDDLDRHRCREDFVDLLLEDLDWLKPALDSTHRPPIPARRALPRRARGAHRRRPRVPLHSARAATCSSRSPRRTMKTTSRIYPGRCRDALRRGLPVQPELSPANSRRRIHHRPRPPPGRSHLRLRSRLRRLPALAQGWRALLPTRHRRRRLRHGYHRGRPRPRPPQIRCTPDADCSRPQAQATALVPRGSRP